MATTLKKSKWKDFNTAVIGIKAGMDKAAEDRAERWMAKVEPAFKQYTPVASGNLRDSIESSVVEKGKKYVVGVNTEKLYAGMRLVGERPHNYVYEAGWDADSYLPDITVDESLRNFIKGIWFEYSKLRIKEAFLR